ncbi:hypothetical protein LINPERHAP1_LOCUS37987 [Linum perenne]
MCLSNRSEVGLGRVQVVDHKAEAYNTLKRVIEYVLSQWGTGIGCEAHNTLKRVIEYVLSHGIENLSMNLLVGFDSSEPIYEFSKFFNKVLNDEDLILDVVHCDPEDEYKKRFKISGERLVNLKVRFIHFDRIEVYTPNLKSFFFHKVDFVHEFLELTLPSLDHVDITLYGQDLILDVVHCDPEDEYKKRFRISGERLVNLKVRFIHFDRIEVYTPNLKSFFFHKVDFVHEFLEQTLSSLDHVDITLYGQDLILDVVHCDPEDEYKKRFRISGERLVNLKVRFIHFDRIEVYTPNLKSFFFHKVDFVHEFLELTLPSLDHVDITLYGQAHNTLKRVIEYVLSHGIENLSMNLLVGFDSSEPIYAFSKFFNKVLNDEDLILDVVHCDPEDEYKKRFRISGERLVNLKVRFIHFDRIEVYTPNLKSFFFHKVDFVHEFLELTLPSLDHVDITLYDQDLILDVVHCDPEDEYKKRFRISGERLVNLKVRFIHFDRIEVYTPNLKSFFFHKVDFVHEFLEQTLSSLDHVDITLYGQDLILDVVHCDPEDEYKKRFRISGERLVNLKVRFIHFDRIEVYTPNLKSFFFHKVDFVHEFLEQTLPSLDHVDITLYGQDLILDVVHCDPEDEYKKRFRISGERLVNLKVRFIHFDRIEVYTPNLKSFFFHKVDFVHEFLEQTLSSLDHVDITLYGQDLILDVVHCDPEDEYKKRFRISGERLVNLKVRFIHFDRIEVYTPNLKSFFFHKVDFVHGFLEQTLSSLDHVDITLYGQDLILDVVHCDPEDEYKKRFRISGERLVNLKVRFIHFDRIEVYTPNLKSFFFHKVDFVHEFLEQTLSSLDHVDITLYGQDLIQDVVHCDPEDEYKKRFRISGERLVNLKVRFIHFDRIEVYTPNLKSFFFHKVDFVHEFLELTLPSLDHVDITLYGQDLILDVVHCDPEDEYKKRFRISGERLVNLKVRFIHFDRIEVYTPNLKSFFFHKVDFVHEFLEQTLSSLDHVDITLYGQDLILDVVHCDPEDEYKKRFRISGERLVNLKVRFIHFDRIEVYTPNLKSFFFHKVDFVHEFLELTLPSLDHVDITLYGQAHNTLKRVIEYVLSHGIENLSMNLLVGFDSSEPIYAFSKFFNKVLNDEDLILDVVHCDPEDEYKKRFRISGERLVNLKVRFIHFDRIEVYTPNLKSFFFHKVDFVHEFLELTLPSLDHVDITLYDQAHNTLKRVIEYVLSHGIENLSMNLLVGFDSSEPIYAFSKFFNKVLNDEDLILDVVHCDPEDEYKKRFRISGERLVNLKVRFIHFDRIEVYTPNLKSFFFHKVDFVHEFLELTLPSLDHVDITLYDQDLILDVVHCDPEDEYKKRFRISGERLVNLKVRFIHFDRIEVYTPNLKSFFFHKVDFVHEFLEQTLSSLDHVDITLYGQDLILDVVHCDPEDEYKKRFRISGERLVNLKVRFIHFDRIEVYTPNLKSFFFHKVDFVHEFLELTLPSLDHVDITLYDQDLILDVVHCDPEDEYKKRFRIPGERLVNLKVRFIHFDRIEVYTPNLKSFFFHKVDFVHEFLEQTLSSLDHVDITLYGQDLILDVVHCDPEDEYKKRFRISGERLVNLKVRFIHFDRIEVYTPNLKSFFFHKVDFVHEFLEQTLSSLDHVDITLYGQDLILDVVHCDPEDEYKKRFRISGERLVNLKVRFIHFDRIEVYTPNLKSFFFHKVDFVHEFLEQTLSSLDHVDITLYGQDLIQDVVHCDPEDEYKKRFRISGERLVNLKVRFIHFDRIEVYTPNLKSFFFHKVDFVHEFLEQTLSSLDHVDITLYGQEPIYAFSKFFNKVLNDEDLILDVVHCDPEDEYKKRFRISGERLVNLKVRFIHFDRIEVYTPNLKSFFFHKVDFVHEFLELTLPSLDHVDITLYGQAHNTLKRVIEYVLSHGIENLSMNLLVGFDSSEPIYAFSKFFNKVLNDEDLILDVVHCDPEDEYKKRFRISGERLVNLKVRFIHFDRIEVYTPNLKSFFFHKVDFVHEFLELTLPSLDHVDITLYDQDLILDVVHCDPEDEYKKRFKISGERLVNLKVRFIHFDRIEVYTPNLKSFFFHKVDFVHEFLELTLPSLDHVDITLYGQDLILDVVHCDPEDEYKKRFRISGERLVNLKVRFIHFDRIEVYTPNLKSFFFHKVDFVHEFLELTLPSLDHVDITLYGQAYNTLKRVIEYVLSHGIENLSMNLLVDFDSSEPVYAFSKLFSKVLNDEGMLILKLESMKLDQSFRLQTTGFRLLMKVELVECKYFYDEEVIKPFGGLLCLEDLILDVVHCDPEDEYKKRFRISGERLVNLKVRFIHFDRIEVYAPNLKSFFFHKVDFVHEFLELTLPSLDHVDIMLYGQEDLILDVVHCDPEDEYKKRFRISGERLVNLKVRFIHFDRIEVYAPNLKSFFFHKVDFVHEFLELTLPSLDHVDIMIYGQAYNTLKRVIEYVLSYGIENLSMNLLVGFDSSEPIYAFSKFFNKVLNDEEDLILDVVHCDPEDEYKKRFRISGERLVNLKVRFIHFDRIEVYAPNLKSFFFHKVDFVHEFLELTLPSLDHVDIMLYGQDLILDVVHCDPEDEYKKRFRISGERLVNLKVRFIHFDRIEVYTPNLKSFFFHKVDFVHEFLDLTLPSLDHVDITLYGQAYNTLKRVIEYVLSYGIENLSMNLLVGFDSSEPIYAFSKFFNKVLNDEEDLILDVVHCDPEDEYKKRFRISGERLVNLKVRFIHFDRIEVYAPNLKSFFFHKVDFVHEFLELTLPSLDHVDIMLYGQDLILDVVHCDPEDEYKKRFRISGERLVNLKVRFIHFDRIEVYTPNLKSFFFHKVDFVHEFLDLTLPSLDHVDITLYGQAYNTLKRVIEYVLSHGIENLSMNLLVGFDSSEPVYAFSKLFSKVLNDEGMLILKLESMKLDQSFRLQTTGFRLLMKVELVECKYFYDEEVIKPFGGLLCLKDLILDVVHCDPEDEYKKRFRISGERLVNLKVRFIHFDRIEVYAQNLKSFFFHKVDFVHEFLELTLPSLDHVDITLYGQESMKLDQSFRLQTTGFRLLMKVELVECKYFYDEEVIKPFGGLLCLEDLILDVVHCDPEDEYKKRFRISGERLVNLKVRFIHFDRIEVYAPNLKSFFFHKVDFVHEFLELTLPSLDHVDIMLYGQAYNTLKRVIEYVLSHGIENLSMNLLVGFDSSEPIYAFSKFFNKVLNDEDLILDVVHCDPEDEYKKRFRISGERLVNLKVRFIHFDRIEVYAPNLKSFFFHKVDFVHEFLELTLPSLDHVDIMLYGQDLILDVVHCDPEDEYKKRFRISGERLVNLKVRFIHFDRIEVYTPNLKSFFFHKVDFVHEFLDLTLPSLDHVDITLYGQAYNTLKRVIEYVLSHGIENLSMNLLVGFDSSEPVYAFSKLFSKVLNDDGMLILKLESMKLDQSFRLQTTGFRLLMKVELVECKYFYDEEVIKPFGGLLCLEDLVLDVVHCDPEDEYKKRFRISGERLVNLKVRFIHFDRIEVYAPNLKSFFFHKVDFVHEFLELTLPSLDHVDIMLYGQDLILDVVHCDPEDEYKKRFRISGERLVNLKVRFIHFDRIEVYTPNLKSFFFHKVDFVHEFLDLTLPSLDHVDITLYGQAYNTLKRVIEYVLSHGIENLSMNLLVGFDSSEPVYAFSKLFSKVLNDEGMLILKLESMKLDQSFRLQTTGFWLLMKVELVECKYFYDEEVIKPFGGLLCLEDLILDVVHCDPEDEYKKRFRISGERLVNLKVRFIHFDRIEVYAPNLKSFFFHKVDFVHEFLELTLPSLDHVDITLYGQAYNTLKRVIEYVLSHGIENLSMNLLVGFDSSEPVYAFSKLFSKVLNDEGMLIMKLESMKLDQSFRLQTTGFRLLMKVELVECKYFYDEEVIKPFGGLLCLEDLILDVVHCDPEDEYKKRFRISGERLVNLKVRFIHFDRIEVYAPNLKSFFFHKVDFVHEFLELTLPSLDHVDITLYGQAYNTLKRVIEYVLSHGIENLSMNLLVGFDSSEPVYAFSKLFSKVLNDEGMLILKLESMKLDQSFRLQTTGFRLLMKVELVECKYFYDEEVIKPFGGLLCLEDLILDVVHCDPEDEYKKRFRISGERLVNLKVRFIHFDRIEVYAPNLKSFFFHKVDFVHEFLELTLPSLDHVDIMLYGQAHNTLKRVIEYVLSHGIENLSMNLLVGFDSSEPIYAFSKFFNKVLNDEDLILDVVHCDPEDEYKKRFRISGERLVNLKVRFIHFDRIEVYAPNLKSFFFHKEKEYKDALEAFNDKNKKKVQLITKLMELESMKLDQSFRLQTTGFRLLMKVELVECKYFYDEEVIKPFGGLLCLEDLILDVVHCDPEDEYKKRFGISGERLVNLKVRFIHFDRIEVYAPNLKSFFFHKVYFVNEFLELTLPSLDHVDIMLYGQAHNTLKRVIEYVLSHGIENLSMNLLVGFDSSEPIYAFSKFFNKVLNDEDLILDVVHCDPEDEYKKRFRISGERLVNLKVRFIHFDRIEVYAPNLKSFFFHKVDFVHEFLELTLPSLDHVDITLYGQAYNTLKRVIEYVLSHGIENLSMNLLVGFDSSEPIYAFSKFFNKVLNDEDLILDVVHCDPEDEYKKRFRISGERLVNLKVRFVHFDRIEVYEPNLKSFFFHKVDFVHEFLQLTLHSLDHVDITLYSQAYNTLKRVIEYVLSHGIKNLSMNLLVGFDSSEPVYAFSKLFSKVLNDEGMLILKLESMKLDQSVRIQTTGFRLLMKVELVECKYFSNEEVIEPFGGFLCLEDLILDAVHCDPENEYKKRVIEYVLSHGIENLSKNLLVGFDSSEPVYAFSKSFSKVLNDEGMLILKLESMKLDQSFRLQTTGFRLLMKVELVECKYFYDEEVIKPFGGLLCLEDLILDVVHCDPEDEYKKRFRISGERLVNLKVRFIHFDRIEVYAPNLKSFFFHKVDFVNEFLELTLPSLDHVDIMLYGQAYNTLKRVIEYVLSHGIKNLSMNLLVGFDSSEPVYAFSKLFSKVLNDEGMLILKLESMKLDQLVRIQTTGFRLLMKVELVECKYFSNEEVIEPFGGFLCLEDLILDAVHCDPENEYKKRVIEYVLSHGIENLSKNLLVGFDSSEPVYAFSKSFSKVLNDEGMLILKLESMKLDQSFRLQTTGFRLLMKVELVECKYFYDEEVIKPFGGLLCLEDLILDVVHCDPEDEYKKRFRISGERLVNLKVRFIHFDRIEVYAPNLKSFFFHKVDFVNEFLELTLPSLDHVDIMLYGQDLILDVVHCDPEDEYKKRFRISGERLVNLKVRFIHFDRIEVYATNLKSFFFHKVDFVHEFLELTLPSLDHVDIMLYGQESMKLDQSFRLQTTGFRLLMKVELVECKYFYDEEVIKPFGGLLCLEDLILDVVHCDPEDEYKKRFRISGERLVNLKVRFIHFDRIEVYAPNLKSFFFHKVDFVNEFLELTLPSLDHVDIMLYGQDLILDVVHCDPEDEYKKRFRISGERLVNLKVRFIHFDRIEVYATNLKSFFFHKVDFVHEFLELTLPSLDHVDIMLYGQAYNTLKRVIEYVLSHDIKNLSMNLLVGFDSSEPVYAFSKLFSKVLNDEGMLILKLESMKLDQSVRIQTTGFRLLMKVELVECKYFSNEEVIEPFGGFLCLEDLILDAVHCDPENEYKKRVIEYVLSHGIENLSKNLLVGFDSSEPVYAFSKSFSKVLNDEGMLILKLESMKLDQSFRLQTTGFRLLMKVELVECKYFYDEEVIKPFGGLLCLEDLILDVVHCDPEDEYKKRFRISGERLVNLKVRFIHFDRIEVYAPNLKSFFFHKVDFVNEFLELTLPSLDHVDIMLYGQDLILDVVHCDPEDEYKKRFRISGERLVNLKVRFIHFDRIEVYATNLKSFFFHKVDFVHEFLELTLPSLDHVDIMLYGQGDWSNRPVIDQNTCYKMWWGTCIGCEAYNTLKRVIEYVLSHGIENLSVNLLVGFHSSKPVYAFSKLFSKVLNDEVECKYFYDEEVIKPFGGLLCLEDLILDVVHCDPEDEYKKRFRISGERLVNLKVRFIHFDRIEVYEPNLKSFFFHKVDFVHEFLQLTLHSLDHVDITLYSQAYNTLKRVIEYVLSHGIKNLSMNLLVGFDSSEPVYAFSKLFSKVLNDEGMLILKLESMKLDQSVRIQTTGFRLLMKVELVECKYFSNEEVIEPFGGFLCLEDLILDVVHCDPEDEYKKRFRISGERLVNLKVRFIHFDRIEVYAPNLKSFFFHKVDFVHEFLELTLPSLDHVDITLYGQAYNTLKRVIEYVLSHGIENLSVNLLVGFHSSKPVYAFSKLFSKVLNDEGMLILKLESMKLNQSFRLQTTGFRLLMKVELVECKYFYDEEVIKPFGGLLCLEYLILDVVHCDPEDEYKKKFRISGERLVNLKVRFIHFDRIEVYEPNLKSFFFHKVDFVHEFLQLTLHSLDHVDITLYSQAHNTLKRVIEYVLSHGIENLSMNLLVGFDSSEPIYAFSKFFNKVLNDEDLILDVVHCDPEVEYKKRFRISGERLVNLKVRFIHFDRIEVYAPNLKSFFFHKVDFVHEFLELTLPSLDHVDITLYGQAYNTLKRVIEYVLSHGIENLSVNLLVGFHSSKPVYAFSKLFSKVLNDEGMLILKLESMKLNQSFRLQTTGFRLLMKVELVECKYFYDEEVIKPFGGLLCLEYLILDVVHCDPEDEYKKRFRISGERLVNLKVRFIHFNRIEVYEPNLKSFFFHKVDFVHEFLQLTLHSLDHVDITLYSQAYNTLKRVIEYVLSHGIENLSMNLLVGFDSSDPVYAFSKLFSKVLNDEGMLILKLESMKLDQSFRLQTTGFRLLMKVELVECKYFSDEEVIEPFGGFLCLEDLILDDVHCDPENEYKKRFKISG